MLTSPSLHQARASWGPGAACIAWGWPGGGNRRYSAISTSRCLHGQGLCEMWMCGHLAGSAWPQMARKVAYITNFAPGPGHRGGLGRRALRGNGRVGVVADFRAIFTSRCLYGQKLSEMWMCDHLADSAWPRMTQKDAHITSFAPDLSFVGAWGGVGRVKWAGWG